ncbi:hypothetical protein FRC09_017245, partial [Ceratobasidium sp. 395]
NPLPPRPIGRVMRMAEKEREKKDLCNICLNQSLMECLKLTRMRTLNLEPLHTQSLNP